MTFTDDDLKRLKEWLVYAEEKFNGSFLETFMREMAYSELKTLLSRLEAAEAVIVEADQYGFSDKAIELETAWRKAAGRE